MRRLTRSLGRPSLAVALALLAGSVLGCAAPNEIGEGQAWVAAKYKASDAKLQRVAGHPSVRFDASTLDELDRVLALDDLADATLAATALFDRTYADARASSRNELDILSDAGWRDLNRRYCGADVVPDAAAREQLRSAHADALRADHDALVARLARAGSLGELRADLRRLRRDVAPSVKTAGRVGRAAPWFVFAPISLWQVRSISAREWRGPQDAPFDAAVRYEPGPEAPGTSDAPGPPPPAHWDLLARHAPTIVQEVIEQPPYGEAVDRIGRVTATGADEVAIDTAVPTVYAYARDVRINDHPHVQLVYTHWYPEHPKLKKGVDAEHGRPEGVTLRVTLDDKMSPAIFETVYNCGCYHRLYPSADLEAAAGAQHGRPEPTKVYAIERRVPWKIDLIVPKVIEAAPEVGTEASAVGSDVNEGASDGGRGDRPVIRCRAGWHGIVDVALSEGGHAREVREARRYVLRPYDELERLPLGGGRFTSMFYENGLVKRAQRLEGVFFTPIGMLSAGQPRQRGTQLIHWDHYDFDDPHLFERTLRLPPSF